MAKKEKKEKGFMESVYDGYIRGSMGGEEDTSQARTVTSPEPLPDEIKKFRKLYILVPISLIIGILKGDFTGWLAIAAFILLCLVCLIDTYADHKVRRLRRMKFKLPAGVTSDEFFKKMQPVFISKYGWDVERGDHGELTVLDKKYKYDVNLEEDGTFVIWWRMSVAKAFLGREESADILVDRYGDALTYYINGYIHDIHESEDLMIEAFARVFAKERPIDGKGSFRAYLYKTARNLTIRHTQKHKLWFLHLDEVDFELPSEELVETRLLQNEREKCLYEAMAKLKTEYREALYLVSIEGMSYSEAGKILGKSEQQMTNLVHRGKKSLRKILEQGGFSYADE